MLWALCVPATAGSWTTTTPLPDAFDGHSLVYSSGRLYQMGGISFGGGILDGVKVFSAPATDAGAVGAWTAGPSLPEAVYYHTSAAVNGFIYVLGGFHYTDAAGIVLSNGVYRAKVNSDGTLGAWQIDAPLPQPVFFPSAASFNGRIYVTGGWNGSALINSVYSAQVNADGSLSPWVAQKSLPQAVYTHAAVSNGTLYVLGGTVNGGNDIQNTVYFAKINADGTLADWAATAALPTPVSNHGAVVANGRVFVLGGWDGAEPIAAVDSSLVASDGSLGGWSPETSLPRALYLHATAASATQIFVSGGIDPTAIRAEVYSMPLPPPPLPNDVLPPRTSLAVSGPTIGGVTFLSTASPAALTSVDDRSVIGDGAGVGVAATQVSVDGAPFAAYTAPITVHTDGGHLFQFTSTDMLGHAETVKSASAAVDGTAPVSSLSIGAPRAVLATGETVVSPLTPLAVSAVDPVVNGAASGVALTLAAADGAALAPSTASFVLPAGEGAHVVLTQAFDNVGNAETAHATTVYVDSTPPLTSLALSSPAFAATDGGAPFTGGATALSFAASDPAPAGGVSAGVARTEYALDGGSVAVYEGAFGLPEGLHAVAFRSLDNVGNAEAWHSASYRADLTLPQSALTWTGAPNAPTPLSSFSLSAQDPSSNGVASGVSRIVYSVDGGADAVYARPFSLSLGSHTVSYFAADNAGNVEARNTAAVSVGPADNLPPRTSLAFGSPSFGPVPFISPATPATLTAVDDALTVGDGTGSGVASTQWALDGGSFTVYAAPLRVAGDGSHWIRFFSTDTLGHAEAVRASSAAVDGTAPASSLSIGSPQAVLATGETVVGPATLLAVSAVDPVVNGAASGVALTLAGVDGAALAASTAPFALPAVDGPHTVSLQAVDNVGNAETAHAATVYRDSTPPVTAAALSAPAFAAGDGGAPFTGAGALLSFAAQDPAAGGVSAGVARTEYALDGGSTAAYTGAFGLPEGLHTAAYRSVDNVGNAEAWRSVSYRADLTLPQSALTWTGAPNAPTPLSSFSLSAQDPSSNGVASGVSRIVYSLDGGADAVYARPFSLSLGSHTVLYFAADNAGNLESRNTATVVVSPADNLPPRTSLAFGSPSFGPVPFISPATPATLTAVDDALTAGDGTGAGVASTQWALDGGSFTVYAAPLRVAGDGSHWIRFFSTDTLGHAEAVRASSAAVDGTAPVSSLSIGSPQAVLATGETVVGPATLLAVSAVDPVVNGAASGVALTLAGVDGAALAASTAPFALPAVDGPHAVSLQAVDNVGNAETAHAATVYRDSTPPVTALAFSAAPYMGASGPIYGAAAVLSFSAVDPAAGGVAAGVNRTEYALDGGAAIVYAGAFAAAEGAHSLSYRSFDNVGNAEAARVVSFAVDATPPQTTLTVGGGGTTLLGQDVLTADASVTLSAQDPSAAGVSSGVKRVLYSIDGGADIVYTGPFHLTAGLHNVGYGAEDNAGNVETRGSAALNVGSFLTDALAATGNVDLSNKAGVVGTVRTNAAFTAEDKAFVTGDVAGLSVTLDDKSTVSGSITRGQATFLPPAYNLAAARAWAQAHNNNAALPARMWSGGALVLDGRDAETLPAGDYYLTGLRLRGKSSLAVSGRVNVFLDGPLTVRGGSSLNGSGDAANLWIVSADASADAYESSGDGDDRDSSDDEEDARTHDESVFLNGKTRSAFNIYAPLGALRAIGSGQYAGRILAKTASLSGTALQPSTTALPPISHAPGAPEHRAAPPARSGEGTASDGHAGGRDSAVAFDRLDDASPAVAVRGASVPAAAAPSGPAPELAAAAPPAAPHEPTHLAPAPALNGSGTAGPGRSGGRDAAVLSSRLDSNPPALSARGSSIPPPGASPAGSAPAVAAAPPSGPREVKHLTPIPAPSSGAGTAGPGRSGGRDAAVVASVADFQDADRRLGAPVLPQSPSGSPAPGASGSAARTARSRMPSFPLAPRAAFSAVSADGSSVRAGDRTAVVIPAGATDGIGVTVAPAKPDVLEAKRQSDVQTSKGLVAASSGVQYGPEGTRFAKPVTLEMPYDRAHLPAGVAENDLAIHYWNPVTGDWEKLESSVDVQNQIVRAQTSHFSLYQLFGGGSTVQAASDPSFSLRSAYAFPNPARGVGAVVIRVQVGQADSVEVRVYDLTGRRVHASSDFTLNPSFDDGNGTGPQFTYAHAWDLSGVASGVYTYVITAKKAGAADIHKTGRVGVVK